MEGKQDTKRQRRTNFSQVELDILVSEVERRHSFLFGRLSSTVTLLARKKAWCELTERINANTTLKRDPEEVRKKWTDFRAFVKKKESKRRKEMRKTGGGPAPLPLSDIEQRLEGIEGGSESEIFQSDTLLTIQAESGETGTTCSADTPDECSACEDLIVSMVNSCSSLPASGTSLPVRGSNTCVNGSSLPMNSNQSSGSRKRRSQSESGEITAPTYIPFDLQMTDNMWNTVILFVFAISVHGDIYDICISPQWEGVQTLLTGTEEEAAPTFIQTTNRISFDANSSRIAAFTSGSQNGGHFQKDYLFLYDKKIVYIVKDGACYAEKLIAAFPPLCLPSHFTWTMWRTWYGEEKMGSQLWIFGYDGVVKDLTYSVQMSLEIRLVATQQIRGNINNVPFFQTTATVNTTRGIKNPDVFTLPSVCKTAELKGNFTTPASIYGMFLPG